VEKFMKNIKPHVLLVEDSKPASMVASMILTELGCLVDVADTGEKALELVNQNKYDLIFMDLGLPNTTGIEVTEKIKQIEEMQKIPVIALTAHGTDEMKENCFKVGMAGFIVKPLEAERADSFLKKHVKK